MSGNCAQPGQGAREIEQKFKQAVNLLCGVGLVHFLRRAGQPSEVAGTVSYLMSDEAGYVTRQTVCIDGGMS